MGAQCDEDAAARDAPAHVLLVEGDHVPGQQVLRAELVQQLARVGLREPDRVLKSYPHELSGGMAQRVAFAAATIGMDVLSMSAYGLGGAALARRMSEPRFRRGFALATGSLLLVAAGLIVTRL